MVYSENKTNNGQGVEREGSSETRKESHKSKFDVLIEDLKTDIENAAIEMDRGEGTDLKWMTEKRRLELFRQKYDNSGAFKGEELGPRMYREIGHNLEVNEETGFVFNNKW